MQHAKFFSIFIFFALSIYGGVSFYFLPSASFDGDLTRMAMLPESFFGWTKAQPAIDAALMEQASIQDADVFVIGDSFSEGRVWQSVLTKAGLKVRTESWKSMGDAICADITPWLRARGFMGKYVILETVEREIVKKMTQSVRCAHMPPRPDSTSDTSRDPPPTILHAVHGHYAGRLSTRFRMFLNVLRYRQLIEGKDFKTWTLSNNVKMVRKDDGCEFFSHVQCKDSLFLAGDSPEQVNESAIENIKTMNEWFTGVTPIWVFVPNKSTTYLYPDKTFWNQIEEHVLAPNLLSMTRHAVQTKTVDIYPANNTHLSTTGYLLMGQEVWKTMRSSDSSTSFGKKHSDNVVRREH